MTTRSSPSPLSPPSPLLEILLLGCESSGKTCVTRRCKQMCTATAVVAADDEQKRRAVKSGISKAQSSPVRQSNRSVSSGGDDDKYTISLATAPTNGVERDTLTFDHVTFVIKEIGGSMRSTWSGYLNPPPAAVVFVLDASDPASLPIAVYELATLLSSDALKSVPFIVLLHKIDSLGAMSRDQIQTMTRIDEIIVSTNGAKRVIIETSAVDSSGVRELLDELVKSARQRAK